MAEQTKVVAVRGAAQADENSAEAILAGTRNNAVAMGIADQVGSVRAGLAADLLVVDGDPLADIRILGDKRRLAHIFVGGRAVSREPPRPRAAIGGWRVGQFAERALTWDMAHGHD